MSKYIQHYPESLKNQVAELIDNNQLGKYLLKKYPVCHEIKNDSQLYTYAQDLKKQTMKQSAPLKQISFDGKLSASHAALGLNTHRVQNHGKKLKTIKSIKIASLFRTVPEPFLKMIVGHELAHIREMEHNKPFYKLCEHIVPSYSEIELDLRLYLTLKELGEDIYS